MPIEFHEGCGPMPEGCLRVLRGVPHSTRMAYFAARVATHLAAYKEASH